MGVPISSRVVVLATLVAAAPARPADAQLLQFAERASAVGLSCTHAPFSTFGLEFQNAGGAVADFNHDGRPDVFVLGGALGVDKLYINQGDGAFADQAPAWGVDWSHAGSGACAGKVRQ